MQKNTSGKVDNSSANSGAREKINNEHQEYTNWMSNKNNKDSSPTKLKNQIVEPKIVNSNFFDSDQEDKSERKTSLCKDPDETSDNFSQIMRKLRSKYNLKFQSQNNSVEFSQQTESFSKMTDQTLSKKNSIINSNKQKKVSNLLNNLFKEMKAGEKMCNDTYTKVNKRNDVKSFSIFNI